MRDFATITGRTIKVALVGCGRISGKHFEAFRQHGDDLELVAVCDTNRAALENAVEATGAEGYARLEQLLDESGADLITICTPSGLHPEQVIRCAEAGCHVVTEKPMATRWNDGMRMVRVCDEAGVRLFVVKQNRHNTTLQMLKRAVSAGRFGRIYTVHLNVFWARPQEYYDSASWRGTWEFDGGAFMNQASHYVDALEWLIGEPESVMGMTSTTARKIETEDMGAAIVKFRNGVIATINVSMLT